MATHVDLRPARPDEEDELYRTYRETALAAYRHVFPPMRYRFPSEEEHGVWHEFVTGHGRSHHYERHGWIRDHRVRAAGHPPHPLIVGYTYTISRSAKEGPARGKEACGYEDLRAGHRRRPG